METKETKTTQLSVGGALEINGREFHKFYKANRKKTAEGLRRYNLVKRSIGAMFNEIKKMMLEAEGGVYLEGFGYFCFLMSPHKTSKKVHYKCAQKNSFSVLKKQHRYYPYFFAYTPVLKAWSMSMAFKLEFYKQMKMEIKSGRRYKILYTQVKQLIEATRQTKATKHKNIL